MSENLKINVYDREIEVNPNYYFNSTKIQENPEMAFNLIPNCASILLTSVGTAVIAKAAYSVTSKLFGYGYDTSKIAPIVLATSFASIASHYNPENDQDIVEYIHETVPNLLDNAHFLGDYAMQYIYHEFIA